MPVEMELTDTVRTSMEKAYSDGWEEWERSGEQGVPNPFLAGSELWDAWNQGYWDSATEQYG